MDVMLKMQSGVHRSEIAPASADDQTADLYRSLLANLDRESELRGRSRLSHEPVRPGQMGAGMVESIVVTLISSGGLAALVRAWTVWVRYRTSDVQITVTDGSGESVTLKATRVDDPTGLIKELEQLGRREPKQTAQRELDG
jgi:hypothetical protein